MSKLQKCAICGKRYEYCPHCEKERPGWLAMFCSENCKRLYETCLHYNIKSIDKETAKELLSTIDLSNKANFTKQVQKDISNILSDDVVEEKAEVKVEEKVDSLAEKINKTAKAVEEQKNEKKDIKVNNRNYSKKKANYKK